MLRIITLMLVILTIHSQANTVYKCLNGDQVTFSQMPCETDNTENELLDYSNNQNIVSSPEVQSSSTQNKTPPNTYLLSQKKERSLAKIKLLKQKLSSELEEVKTNAFTAGVNRAGSSYLKVLETKFIEIRDKYKKSIEKEQKTLDRIEQELSQLEQ